MILLPAAVKVIPGPAGPARIGKKNAQLAGTRFPNYYFTCQPAFFLLTDPWEQIPKR
jgi:hypothetical protein